MLPHLLSFVTNTSGSFLSIHADLRGVEYLIRELEQLRSQLTENDCPHTHLFTADCGGDEPTTAKLQGQPDEDNIVHHVKTYGWTEEWAHRHGLKS